jgi:multiple sugar transport system permease protein
MEKMSAGGAIGAPRPISPLADRRGLKAGQRHFGRLLLLPALAVFAVFILWPFLRAIGVSLYRDTADTPNPVFIGLANFAAIFQDPAVPAVFVATTIYVAAVTTGTMVLGLGWALIVHQPFKGRGTLRAMSLLPWVMPSTVCAFIWGWIFNGRYGVLNAVLMSLGVIDYPKAWLSSSAGAMTAIVVTRIWLSVPLYMAFFLAGLQTLDKEGIEAARVDGAGNWQVLRDHVLPHLRPVMVVVVMLGVIGNLQHFDTIFALTGGGPVRATTVLSVDVYRRAFESFDLGMASAMGVLWIATILPPAWFYLRRMLRED